MNFCIMGKRRNETGMKIFFVSICILPLMVIFYFVLKMAGRKKGRLLLGVTLWEGAEEDQQVKDIQKQYNKYLMYVNLFILAITIICCIPDRESIVMAAMMILILVTIVVYFLPIVVCNKKLKTLKMEHCSELNMNQEITMVDMKAASEKKEVHFLKSTLVPVITGVIIFAVELFFGKGEMKEVKLIIIGTMNLVGLIMLAMLFVMRGLRVEVVSLKSQINILYSRARSYQWSKIIMITTWLTTVYIIYLYLRMDSLSTTDVEILVVSMVYSFCIIGVVISIERNLREIRNKYDKFLDGVEDDDKHWLYGIIYNNKNDKRFMVPQRVGMGTTINMAKPSAKIFMGITIIGTILIIIGSSIFILLQDFTPVRLNVQDGMVVSSQIGEKYSIDIDDIELVEIISELPRLNKKAGTGMETLYKGSFRDRETGDSCSVCVRRTNEAYIKIVTSQMTYYLNDDTVEKTMEVYNELTKYIN